MVILVYPRLSIPAQFPISRAFSHWVLPSWRLEIVGAVFRRKAIEDDPVTFLECIDGAGQLGSERDLELQESHLDQAHTWRIWRQGEQLRLVLGENIGDAGDLVGRKVVHNDDVTGSERRREDLGGIGLEPVAIYHPHHLAEPSARP